MVPNNFKAVYEMTVSTNSTVTLFDVINYLLISCTDFMFIGIIDFIVHKKVIVYSFLLFRKDLSYYCCIEVCGPEDNIITGLRKLTSADVGKY